MLLESFKGRCISERVGLLLGALWLLFLSIGSVIVISVVPGYSTGLMAWTEISPANWLRLIVALYLTSFAPGYCILRISKGLNYLGHLSAFLLSYLLSLFLTGLLGFVLLVSHHSIQEYGSLSLVLANIVLAAIATVRYRERRTHVKLVNTRIVVHLSDIIVILITLGVITGAIVINTSNSFFLFGVQNFQINQATAYFKDFPVGLQGNSAGSYDYWFFIYIANFIRLSGFPIVNAFLSLLLFAGMPTLAFFEMVKRLTKSKTLGVITTIMMSFQGFGWIYATHLILTNPSYSLFDIFWTMSTGTYEFRNAVVWLPNLVDPIFLVALPTFCFLVYLAFESSLPRWTKYLFISPLVALGYLSHHYEIVFFIVVYSLVASLGQILKVYAHDFNTTLSITLGLAFVGLIDFLSPGKQYVITQNISPSGPLLHPSLTYILAMALSLLPFVVGALSTIKTPFFTKLYYRKILTRRRIQSISSKQNLRVILCGLLVFTYLTLAAIWLNVHQDIAVGEYSFVPIYAYPVRFGVNGIIAVLTLMLIILGIPLMRRDGERRFFLLMSMMGLIAFGLGRISSFLGLDYDARVQTFLLMSLATISALTIRSLYSLRQSKKVARALSLRKLGVGLIILIFLLGAMSSIFYVKFWSVVTASQGGIANMSKDEVEALNFLRAVVNPSDYVLTVSAVSRIYLTTLAGLTNELYYPENIGESISNTFWTASTPEALSYLFNKTAVKYVYLAQRDITMLEYSSDSFLYNLLNFFPVIYSNSEVKILQVPTLTSPLAFRSEDSWIDQHFRPTDWTVTYVQNVSDVEANLSEGQLQIGGVYNRTRGTIIMRRDGLDLSTDKYPFFIVEWRGSGNVASVVIWYKDGSATIALGGLSTPYWRETTVLLPSNKTIGAIELRADNNWAIERGDNLEGYCSASYGYVKLSSFGELLHEMMNSTMEYGKQMQTLSYTNGNITLEGNIEISSSGLKQILGDLFFMNDSNETTVRELAGNGQVDVTVQCENAIIVPSNFGNVTQITVTSPSNVSITLPKKSELIATLSESQMVTLRNGSYLFKYSHKSGEPLEIILQKPELSVHGNVTFDSAFFWPHEPRSWGENLVIEGTSSFSIISSDNSFLVLNVEEAEGKVETSQVPQYGGQRNELTDICNFVSSLSGLLSLLIVSTTALLITAFLRKLLKHVDLHLFLIDKSETGEYY